MTALRDSIGYGFYFWSYELAGRWMASSSTSSSSAASSAAGDGGGWGGSVISPDAARVLLCGGLAGVVTWASIFPLDVIKTRVQTQNLFLSSPPTSATATVARPREHTLLLSPQTSNKQTPRLGAWEITKETYRQGGIKPFFHGLAVCSVRAFIVNAVQWAVYEWIMLELGQGKRVRSVHQTQGQVGLGELREMGDAMG